uniref:MAM domain-containing protein n=1 Tax=Trichobilharzia regenti TaxID=157069 RepID=A0AA85KQ37_TRIRE|nr:unnamed protein product [Trichobilharzia regenti]
MTIYIPLIYTLLLAGNSYCTESGCQFSQNTFLKPNQLWWTHDGYRLPPVSFNLNDYQQSFAVKQGFDLTAAAEGWNQMLISSNTDILWIQQLCLNSYQHISIKRGSQPKESFSQLHALFNGLTAFGEGDWCSRNMPLWNSEEISVRKENIFVHLVHYRIICEKFILGKFNKYVVKIDIPNSGPVYQCVYFLPVNKNDPGKIINVIHSKHVSLHPDESLCDDNAEYDSILWIPSLSKNAKDLFTPCPFVGGFQIINMRKVGSEKPICDYQTFATMESECVTNEGIEWVFDDPKCNIFEINSISHHSCFTHWKKDGLTFTLLHQDRKDDGHSLFTLIFSDIPEPLNPSDSNYGQHKPIWIYPGLSSKIFQNTSILWDVNSFDFSTEISNRWNQQNKHEIPLYQLYIRRAFGICDDEPTSCTKGCDHDVRNRMFCYKSCPADDKKCKSSHWDSCTFKQNYQGHWNLIEPMSRKGYTSLESSKSKWTSLIFGENYLIFVGKTNESYLCIREVRETIQDWFIIRSRKQANGCQPRDVCLELFQSSIRRSFDARNTNTMELRMSQSKKYGSHVRTLCNFESQSFSVNSKIPQSTTPLILVRNLEPYEMLNPYSDPPIKCGLYQIRLVGTMNINTDYLSDRSNSLSVISLPGRLYELPEMVNTSQSINANYYKKFEPTNFKYSGSYNQPQKSSFDDSSRRLDIIKSQNTIHRRMVKNSISCRVEISDFNLTYGLTGEFGNKIWIHSDCLNHQIKSSFNASHVCLSVYNIFPVELNERRRQLILITYHVATKTYFCWIFKEINRDSIPGYLVYLFDTPQCQYHRLPSGDIQINEENALAQISLTSVSCSKCDLNADRTRKYSGKLESRKSKVLRIPTSQMKQRQTQRALRQSTQTGTKNLCCRGEIRLFLILMLISLSFLSILL